jgi:hypothetical protein
MHSNNHALPSVNSILLDAVSDYDVTPPVNPQSTATELWRLLALTIISEFFFCRRGLYLNNNKLQQLPPGVFSNLTSLRSLTCVVECIENVCVRICV